MDKKNKKNSATFEGFSLSVTELEGILNKETLKNLPILVESMDQNLAINIKDFLNNCLFKELQINNQKMIDVIKQSKKLHYDNKSQYIRFKEKADRNILIFNNFIDSEVDILLKCEFIKNKIKEKSKNLLNKLKGVDKIEKNLLFIFDNEDHSLELEKIINESIKNNEKEFQKVQINLAAESLKRRILPYLDTEISIEDQREIIKSIFNNPIPYIPRRYTVTNNQIKSTDELSLNTTVNDENLPKKNRISMIEKNQSNMIGEIKKDYKSINNNDNSNNPYQDNNTSIRNDFNKTFSNLNRFNASNFNEFNQNDKFNYFYNASNMKNNMRMNKSLVNHDYFHNFSYNIMNNNFYNPNLVSGNNVFNLHLTSKSPNKKTPLNKFDILSQNQIEQKSNVEKSNEKIKKKNIDSEVKDERNSSIKKLDLSNANFYVEILNKNNENSKKSEIKKNYINENFHLQDNKNDINFTLKKEKKTSVNFQTPLNINNERNSVNYLLNTSLDDCKKATPFTKITNQEVNNSFSQLNQPINGFNGYKMHNYNGQINQKVENYLYNNVPTNNKGTLHHHPSFNFSTSQMNFNSFSSMSNKKKSILSNDGYLGNMSQMNSFSNGKLQNTDYSVQEGRMKSKTIYHKKNKNKNSNNYNLYNNTSNNFNNNMLFQNNDLVNQSFINNLIGRSSKMSNFQDNSYNDKKLSFLSYGEESTLMNELNKNLRLIPDKSRKSSMGLIGMLKSGDFSKIRSSALSIDNELGFIKDYELNADKSSSITYQYDTNDIISVYFHMNFLKIFDFPHEFKDIFYEAIMTKEVKPSIEKLKEKTLIIRDRAKTQNLKQNNYSRKRNYSFNKIRLSQNANSYLLMSLIEEGNLNENKHRKRHGSLKS